MNATERLALRQGVEFYEEMHAAVDERTLTILDRRRRTSTVRRRGWLVHRMLLLADLIGLVAAFVLAELLVGLGSAPVDRVDLHAELVIFALSLPAWIVVTKLYGLYDHDEERTDHSTTDDFVGVFHMLTVCAWLFFALANLTKLALPSVPKLLLFWALAIGFVPLARAGARAFCRRHIIYVQNAIIVGAGDVGQLIGHKLLTHPEYGINLVGFVDTDPKERREDLEHLTVLGPPEKLPALVRFFDIERVVVAFSNESFEETLDLIRSMKDLDVQVDLVPRFFELISPGVGIHTVEGLPLVGLPPRRLSRSSMFLKRMLDLSLTIPALLALVPFFAVVALLIKIGSSGPIFFRQTRMGAGGRTFRIFKFRTMCANAEETKPSLAHMNKYARNGGAGLMFKIPDDPRATCLGRWLRRHSLDELPQLINVVRGEMSLVGPRPLILDEDDHVRAWARQRLALKPGLTGPWQVLGRNEIPFDEMVRLDYLYVTGWTPGQDLRLIARTLPVVFGCTPTSDL
jgi:exopolysaccharide biosynthesis polyprenyl glycosylphosphotransferase